MTSYDNLDAQELLFFLIILVVAMIALIVVRRLLKVSFPYFFTGLAGLIIGLIVGSAISNPLTKLPGVYGRWFPMIVNIFVTVSILDLFLAQAQPIDNFLKRFSFNNLKPDQPLRTSNIVMDTSVLIDGRIMEIAHTGFIMGDIIVPQFILNELQGIADSENSIKRAKGRKGLDILEEMQHTNRLVIKIVDDLAGQKEPVDSKLIKVAKIFNAKILTVDYNLNKIAKIQDIEVLNINELAEAIKPILMPGENIVVKIIQEGKELGQGVGYMADGTMIVVENGAHLIGKEVNCEVVRIFQTVAGKMIFVEPKQKKNRARS